jgi:hypothetical protein
MARVVLLSATPADDATDFNLAPLLDLQKCAKRDRFRVHSVTTDPETADLIIFAESYGAGWYFKGVRGHSFVREYRDKCFLFCANPFVIPLLPGIYTGVEQRWSSSRIRAGFYLGVTKNEFTTYARPVHDLPYLFSFMGSIRNAPVRQWLATLVHPRSFFQDTTEEFERVLHREMDQRERLDYYRRYVELTKVSKFVLCPRGLSASSIRVFETMQMGRVPVILSDGWVAPAGPAWDNFAIRVREQDFAQIPRILEEREPEAVEMGQLARREWEEWFSDEVVFHRAVESCLDIKKRRRIPEGLARWPVYLQFLRPFHRRRIAGMMYRALRRAMGISRQGPRSMRI